ncbi:MAG: coniferyl-alcohol dehydrogenase [Azospirillaceae bacterium]|nr:coniferyl-alcohol dehydrogenase [Azospirillaceae bacterium]
MSVWTYEGKRVVIAGCYSGMGEAAARELVRLGAEVHGADMRPSPVRMASFHTVDLRDPLSIDAALDAIGGPIDALFNCAGLPQTFPAGDVMKVNFIGLRHWTEKALPMIRPGGAIASISSTAGFAYFQHLPQILELLATPGFEAAADWCERHADLVGDGYAFSKEASIVWTMMMGTRTIAQGVRTNCICPGPTETPMMPAFERTASARIIDVFTTPIGRRSKPEEQAYPLIFLNSGAASFINGHALNVDGGFVGGITAGQIDLQGLLAQAMAG